MQLNDDVLRAVVAQFDIEPREISHISRGNTNEHWRVDATDKDSFVLRRYVSGNADRRTPASISVEHTVLLQLAGHHWPVAAPIAATHGEHLVEHDGRFYALFPFINGALGPAHSLAHLRVKGRLLARLHEELARLPADVQREGFARAWELDVPGGTFNDVLRAFGAEHRELASAIRGERYRSLRELSRLGYGPLPQQYIHADFTRENLLFDGGELTGVLDFDFVHLDARAVDIAKSITSDCGEPPADTAIVPEAARAFVGGYLDHTRLSDAELRLIVPLMRAQAVAQLAFSIRKWLAGDRTEALMFRIERRARQRLPQLAQRAATIEEALLREADR